MQAGVESVGRASVAERAAAGQVTRETDSAAEAAKWLSWKASRARNRDLLSHLLGHTTLPASAAVLPLPLPVVFAESSRTTLSSGRTPRVKLGLHVLVVDDEQVCRKIAGRFLGELGCTWDSLADGLDVPNALLFTSRPVDVILLEVLMKFSNGLEVCRHLRADMGKRAVVRS
jgi:hypothetical protein